MGSASSRDAAAASLHPGVRFQWAQLREGEGTGLCGPLCVLRPSWPLGESGSPLQGLKRPQRRESADAQVAQHEVLAFPADQDWLCEDGALIPVPERGLGIPPAWVLILETS